MEDAASENRVPVMFHYLSEEALEHTEGQTKLEVFIAGKSVFSVWDGEPEDNNLSRNFVDVFGIAELMERAYKAGLAGERWTFSQMEVEE